MTNELKIIIGTVPLSEIRNNGIGDYLMDEEGVIYISVAKFGDWKDQLLVAIHELTEFAQCIDKGIPEPDIDTFDAMYEKERAQGLHRQDEEAGNDPRAPYYVQHQVATAIELFIAPHLRIDWKDYARKIDKLFATPVNDSDNIDEL